LPLFVALCYFRIKYQNGTKDLFNEAPNAVPITKTESTSAQSTRTNDPNPQNVITNSNSPAEDETLCEQAKASASENYGASGPTWGTFIATSITGPLFGLIPAFSCSSAPPQMQNLNIPSRYSNNDNYKKCYQEKAWKIKKHSTWLGYLSGTAVFFSILGLMVL
jgi:hypothetical protein